MVKSWPRLLKCLLRPAWSCVLSPLVCQLEQKLLKTAKEKMEQLSRAFICRKSLSYWALPVAAEVWNCVLLFYNISGQSFTGARRKCTEDNSSCSSIMATDRTSNRLTYRYCDHCSREGENNFWLHLPHNICMIHWWPTIWFCVVLYFNVSLKRLNLKTKRMEFELFSSKGMFLSADIRSIFF